jgi:hypothetical protein
MSYSADAASAEPIGAAHRRLAAAGSGHLLRLPSSLCLLASDQGFDDAETPGRYDCL